MSNLDEKVDSRAGYPLNNGQPTNNNFTPVIGTVDSTNIDKVVVGRCLTCARVVHLSPGLGIWLGDDGSSHRDHQVELLDTQPVGKDSAPDKQNGEDDWERDKENYADSKIARKVINAVLAYELPLRDRYNQTAKIAYKYLAANGSFYFDKRRREPYWFNNSTKVLYNLEKEDAKTFIADTLHINREDPVFRWILSGIRDHVIEHAPKVEAKRYSYYDAEAKTLYFNHKPGRVLKLDGYSMDEVDNGTDDLLFLWDDDWQPVDPEYECDHSLLENLILSKLSLDDKQTDLSLDDAKILTEKWILGIFFRDILPERAVLALVGEQGSGKTVFVCLIGYMFFGKHFGTLGIESQKQDGAIAYLTNNVYGVFDNADEHVYWLPDLLARTATGQAIPRRKLYTTNDPIKYTTDILLAITARQTPWARLDIIDRLLLFFVKRPGKFLDRQKLKRDVLESRPRLIGELLTLANTAIRKLQKNGNSGEDSPIRLAAFYNFAVNTSDNPEAMKQIFQRIVAVQEDLAYEQEEDLVSLLKSWIDATIKGQVTIDASKVWTESYTPSELYARLSKYAKDNDMRFTVKNSLSLGHSLKANMNTLRVAGIIVKKERTGSKRSWSFSIKDFQKKVEAKPSQLSQPSQTMEKTLENGADLLKPSLEPSHKPSPLGPWKIPCSVTDVTDMTVSEENS